MAVINKRVDDYLYNSKGEEVEGAKKRTITIPGILYGGKRSVKHTLDTSDKGDRALDREREKLEEATRKLWAPHLANIGFNAEKYIARQSGKDEGDEQRDEDLTSEDPDNTTEDSSDSTSEDLSDEDLEAATAPSGSAFGSNNH